MKTFQVVSLTFFMLLFFSCKKDTPEVIQTEFNGPKINVGDGQAWSFIQTDESENPIAIGVQFDAAALNNLPSGGMHAHEFVIELPTEINVAPYDHITLDWNEHGHPPMDVFDLPHFDFHFYFMSSAERDLIGPNDSTQFNLPLAAEHLAPLYLETPGGVPRMGAHVIDLTSPEVAGTGTFTHTFIYGKYNAEINFLEPMVTSDFLVSKQSVVKEIRHPQTWQKPGYYPKNYSISFDESTNLYTFVLKDLQKF